MYFGTLGETLKLGFIFLIKKNIYFNITIIFLFKNQSSRFLRCKITD
jgi:hypothetical protein